MTNRMLFALIFASYVAVVAAEPQGEATYKTSCIRCHAPRYATGMGAPAAHDKKAWHLRLQAGERKVKADPNRFKTAYDYLLYSALRGKNLMVHSGLCHESTNIKSHCTDDALMAAIHYMSQ